VGNPNIQPTLFQRTTRLNEEQTMTQSRSSALIGAILAISFVFSAVARAEELKASSDDGNLGSGFKSEFAEVNGVRLHYVEGGKGPRTIVLLPGWPQTWYAWRKVMPELAKSHRVIAVDTRGMGHSSRTEAGYDTLTAAGDIAALMKKLGVPRYSVVGHDVGMWIAYPLAVQHGEAIDRLVMTEATIPGVTPWPPMLLPPEANAGMTQFMFNQLRDLPEFLVAGREEAYLRWIVAHLAVRPDRVAVDEYVRAYSVPGAMKAGFEYYRAIPATRKQNEQLLARKLRMPVLAVGGVVGAGNATIETMRLVSDDVQGEIIDECGHYIPEECPQSFLKLLKPFLGK
jgi:pimeloyl-ACP methyl ester carboxylesterase